MGVIEVWTIVAIILHFCGVGAFASWPVIAGPFTWSCCTLELWVFTVFIVIVLISLGFERFGSKKKQLNTDLLRLIKSKFLMS